MSTNLVVSDIAWVQVGNASLFSLTATKSVYVKVSGDNPPMNLSSGLITVKPQPVGIAVGPRGVDGGSYGEAGPASAVDAATSLLTQNPVAVSVPDGSCLYARAKQGLATLTYA